jgi:hypothetical protein
MNAVREILKWLGICCLCAIMSPPGGENGPDMIRDAAVAVEITKLDLNESRLSLSYSIKNGTSRDAWICSEVGSIPFEVFLTSDKQTLVIRKRLDVPCSRRWRGLAPVGAYVRVAPGASLVESAEIALPVSPAVLYASGYATESTQPVRHLALEIGYYDEDLPALIHSIFAVADKSGLTSLDVPADILDTYFRGLRVRGVLGGFDDMNKDPYGQGCVRIVYSDQALTGEKVLRLDVNDVSIPYKGE